MSEDKKCQNREKLCEKEKELTSDELDQVCGGAGSLYTVISQLSLPAKN